MNGVEGSGDNSAETKRPPAKKPYSRPMLIKLGTLRDLTMGSTGGSANDGLTRMRGASLKTGRGGRNGRGEDGA